MKLLGILSLKTPFHSSDVKYFAGLFFPFFLSKVFRFKGSDQKMNSSKHILQLKEGLVTSSTRFLFFMILSINGDWVQMKS